MAHLLGYARVSTPGQDPAMQLDALKEAGCYRVFVDTASGKLTERPELDRLLDQLRPGDTLAVWRLDRLGRSLAHLIELAAILEARTVGFRSLNEGIDTTTPGGRLVFHLFGALAEFEQALICERTQKGLEAARARGRSGGRRRVMTTERLALARTMYDSNQYPMATIAKTIGASPASIYRALAADKPIVAAAH
jgi:DNA invertase Pin-like site-specific DNA recombinase